MKVVIGGTYMDYLGWLKENGLTQRGAIYVGNDPHKLMGLELSKKDIVRLYPPPDAAIERVLLTRIRR